MLREFRKLPYEEMHSVDALEFEPAAGLEVD